MCVRMCVYTLEWLFISITGKPRHALTNPYIHHVRPFTRSMGFCCLKPARLRSALERKRTLLTWRFALFHSSFSLLTYSRSLVSSGRAAIRGWPRYAGMTIQQKDGVMKSRNSISALLAIHLPAIVGSGFIIWYPLSTILGIRISCVRGWVSVCVCLAALVRTGAAAGVKAGLEPG